ncbi:PqiB family protein [Shewanella marina]|uniref:PqiB family protein n=1 Tax=Shewanella marina TaxID=487319 RepID=UPI0004722C17|nr:MlaD family protein [Shewanella marina]
MNQIESPKVVKKKLFSPIWLLPLITLILGAWVGIKSIRESGVEILIHFPSATGIEVGKTLVKYQGLTVGKVTDIGLNDDLQSVNVSVLMDYRAQPFLKTHTEFWLVTPKATITGIEGLDTIFSGNYIGIKPGAGDVATNFEALRQAPPIIPNNEGLMVTLMADKLNSIDVGSPIFYRQIPVGRILGYHLAENDKIKISAYIQQQYADLVKVNSHFWNVSGIKVDANLTTGIKVNAESIASIIAGGISFDSISKGPKAANGHEFTLFENEHQAHNGVRFNLETKTADGVNIGTPIVYLGVNIGKINAKILGKDQVTLEAEIEAQYASFLAKTSQFWLSGADISLDGIKHASRLITGNVINFIPGEGQAQSNYRLLEQAPKQQAQAPLLLRLTSQDNPGIKAGAEIRYKQFPIGKVLSAQLSKDMSHIDYQIQINRQFSSLLKQDSYFVPTPPLEINASMEGISVKSGGLDSILNGSIDIIPGQSKQPIKSDTILTLYSSAIAAKTDIEQAHTISVTLTSEDGAGLSVGAPVYYKKMAIGEVSHINWQPSSDDFAIKLNIKRQFKSLINEHTVFWQNAAVTVDASLAGVKVNVAPLKGAITGSIGIGLLPQAHQHKQRMLFSSQQLALQNAQAISIVFPASVKLSNGAPIRYLGHKIGEVSKIALNSNLKTITAKAYIYGEYAAKFTRKDSRYFIVDADISIRGIKAPETLLTGAYIGTIPGENTTLTNHFDGSSQTIQAAASSGLDIILTDTNLGSINVGTPIMYRGIIIGHVSQYKLGNHAQDVEITAHIKQQYQHVINQSSRFFDLSGVKVDIGLFSGAQINTGSLENILAGGIGVATENSTTATNKLAAHTKMPIYPKPEQQWLEWAPQQQ